jgi:molybdopterin converting factor small subunit
MPPATRPSTGTGTSTHDPVGTVGTVTVRLWASARAAAGVPELEVEVPGEVTVAWVRDEVVRRCGDRARLADVLAVCSALVGDQPVGRADPGSVAVPVGATVEFLPPFAGG